MRDVQVVYSKRKEVRVDKYKSVVYQLMPESYLLDRNVLTMVRVRKSFLVPELLTVER